VFDWDRAKDEINRLKHGITFREAASCFADSMGIEVEDIKHSDSERRWIRVAKSAAGRVLTVVFTYRSHGEEQITRIISARQANSKERAARSRQPD